MFCEHLVQTVILVAFQNIKLQNLKYSLKSWNFFGYRALDLMRVYVKRYLMQCFVVNRFVFSILRYKRLTNRYHFPDSYVMMNESTLKNRRSKIVITYLIVFYLFSWLCSIAAPTIHHLCFIITTYYSYLIEVSCSKEFIILVSLII